MGWTPIPSMKPQMKRFISTLLDVDSTPCHVRAYAYSYSTNHRLHVNGRNCGVDVYIVINYPSLPPLQDFNAEKGAGISSRWAYTLKFMVIPPCCSFVRHGAAKSVGRANAPWIASTCRCVNPILLRNVASSRANKLD